MQYGGRAGFRSAHKLLFALLVFRYEPVDLADKLKELLRINLTRCLFTKLQRAFSDGFWHGDRLPERYQKRVTVNSRSFKHQKGRLHRERYGLVAVAWHRSDNSRKGQPQAMGELRAVLAGSIPLWS